MILAFFNICKEPTAVLVEDSSDNFFAASMASIAIFCDGTIIIACGLYGGGLQSFSHFYTKILFYATLLLGLPINISSVVEF